jgi:hypothetical protein
VFGGYKGALCPINVTECCEAESNRRGAAETLRSSDVPKTSEIACNPLIGQVASA